MHSLAVFASVTPNPIIPWYHDAVSKSKSKKENEMTAEKKR